MNGPDETDVAGSELYSPPCASSAFFCKALLYSIIAGRYGAGDSVVIWSVFASAAFTPSWSTGTLPATTSFQFLITPPKNQVKSQACFGSAPYCSVAT